MHAFSTTTTKKLRKKNSGKKSPKKNSQKKFPKKNFLKKMFSKNFPTKNLQKKFPEKKILKKKIPTGARRVAIFLVMVKVSVTALVVKQIRNKNCHENTNVFKSDLLISNMLHVCCV